MDQIFKSYLINKKNDKPSNITTPKIDIKKKDYDSIVRIVDSESDKQLITKQKKR